MEPTGVAPWARRAERVPERDEIEPYTGIRKRIYTDADLAAFLDSPSYGDIWNFVLSLNVAVLGRRLSDVPAPTPARFASLAALMALLEEVERWIPEFPPESGPRRFGNPAFRSWHARLRERAPQMLRALVENHAAGALSPRQVPTVSQELSAYLEQSFGNRTRIDYGSGHECSFVVFLWCLCNAFDFDHTNSEASAVLVLHVFRKYLHVTRRLQDEYMLEPAGSHGVWGLDDYSFLPFLWGSAQLCARDNEHAPGSAAPVIAGVDAQSARPERMVALPLGPELDALSEEYLYAAALRFIKVVKKGRFGEHSPMLLDISQVHGGWQKINSGLIKMYKAEVWAKRVVIQHIVFGTLFPFPDRA
mmetsp:Transcript_10090/g.26951  ORF Transcript_10090/g.26951 Transcript_10090/m.26951 type:complete len:362 (-) Transcript_10090:1391-2476(-)